MRRGGQRRFLAQITTCCGNLLFTVNQPGVCGFNKSFSQQAVWQLWQFFHFDDERIGGKRDWSRHIHLHLFSRTTRSNSTTGYVYRFIWITTTLSTEWTQLTKIKTLSKNWKLLTELYVKAKPFPLKVTLFWKLTNVELDKSFVCDILLHVQHTHKHAYKYTVKKTEEKSRNIL